MTGPSPTVALAIMEALGCEWMPSGYLSDNGKCREHGGSWRFRETDCPTAIEAARAAESAALEAAASDAIPRDALAPGTRQWLRERARVRGQG